MSGLGEPFGRPDVAEAYRLRPDYAEPIYEKLAELTGPTMRALDLGCGTGRVTHRLAPWVSHVTAVDPSSAMLRVAQDAAAHANVTWRCGRAEDDPLTGGPFDLIVAASSVHWMDHATVFPRLRSVAVRDHLFVVIGGDVPGDPPWDPEWQTFLERWIPELTGAEYEPDSGPFTRRMTSYRSWMEVAGELVADTARPVQQTIEHFVECQHSRATFAPDRMGTRRLEFDRELAALLAPHAVDGVITYAVRSSMAWGSIRERPETSGPS